MNPERQQDEQFLERINRHPGLRERMSSILDLVENSSGDVIKADAAEKQALEAVRQLGNEVLHDWADRRIEATSEQFLSEEERVERNGKKKLKWHTSFGEVVIMEPIFRKPGQQFRPFSESAGIAPRGCSLILQRIVVDFGADQAFGRVPHKLKEHYGIELPVSTIRQLTEQHGQLMHEQQTQTYAE